MSENARDLLGVEEVCGLVPVDPHSTEVVSEEIVEGVAGEEAEAVGDPVGLRGIVIEVWLRLLAELANGLGALLVSSGPDTESNAVEGVVGVLLEDVGVVGAVGLAGAGADFDVVRETGLRRVSNCNVVE